MSSIITPGSARRVSRDAARAAGLKRFFTGMPCGRCRLAAERLVSNGACIECRRVKKTESNARPEVIEKNRLRAMMWNATLRGKELKRIANRNNPNRSGYGRRERERNELPLPRVAGHCDNCGKPAKLNWDHDHDLEELGFPVVETHRGWLCFHCNTGLGKLGDTPQSLARALAYTQGKL